MGRRAEKKILRGASTPIPSNPDTIRAALEAAGMEFIPENGGGLGVRLGDSG